MCDFMKATLLNILLIVFTSLTACQDRKNIVVKGQVIDEATGKPIPKAEVVVLCWYSHNIYDASFNKQTLTTDNKGKYQATFEKGHKVDVASKAADYQPNRSYNELHENEIFVTLKLTKAKANPTLVTLLNTDDVRYDENEKSPFLKIRIPGVKSRNDLDLNHIETFGFDFLTLTTSNDTSNCDLWFKIEKKDGQPKTIVASKTGGIIPIINTEIKSSLLYEMPIAPTTGYKQELTLSGNEEGFFILCRNGKTYGKIIWEKASVDISSPDGHGGFYKEYGKHFSCLYQPNGTTDLTYSQTDIDLEDFLVDYRQR